MGGCQPQRLLAVARGGDFEADLGEAGRDQGAGQRVVIDDQR